MFFNILVIGDVDGLKPLEEVDVVLQLLYCHFQTFLVGLLGQAVRDEREALVLTVQLMQVLPQALHSEPTWSNTQLSQ